MNESQHSIYPATHIQAFQKPDSKEIRISIETIVRVQSLGQMLMGRMRREFKTNEAHKEIDLVMNLGALHTEVYRLQVMGSGVEDLKASSALIPDKVMMTEAERLKDMSTFDMLYFNNYGVKPVQ